MTVSYAAENEKRVSSATAPSSTSIDLRTLGEQLAEIPATSDSELTALERFVRYVSLLTSAQSTAYFSVDHGENANDSEVVTHQFDDRDVLEQASKLSSLTIGERSAQTTRVSERDDLFAVCVPVVRSKFPDEAIVVIIQSTEPTKILPGIVQIMQLLSAFASQWRGQICEDQEWKQLRLFLQLSDLLDAASKETTTERFASALTTSMRQHFGMASVAFLSTVAKPPKLLAFSPANKFDRHSELAKTIVSAVDEVVLHARNSPARNTVELDEVNTDATRQLAERVRSDQIGFLILRGADAAPIGVCVLIANGRDLQDRETLEFAGKFLGRQFDLFERAKPGLLRRIRIAYRATSRRRWYVSVGVPVLALVFLMAVPLPLKIKTNCTVQPETRRYIASPYEGRLEQVFVEPGDLVQEGDVLARMDAREIRWELGVVRADHERARKQWDAAMAPGSRDTSTAQIAALDMERLELKLEMLENREKNLDIKSPTDGVVISGDPKKLEGARLSMGQTLAEVGPLDTVMFELEIADEDIAHAAVGDKVQIRLDSMPGAKLSGTVSRIHPRSEQRGEKNVFIGDVSIDSDISLQLRPGMNGTAKIVGRRHALAWNLFHKAWEQVLFRIGW